MPLRYSNKQQLNYSGQQRADPWSRFPSHVRPMNSAPISGSQPVKLFEADGKARWGLHHCGAWREVQRFQDNRTGTYSVRMNGSMITPVCWASS
jgi:hypothetical protein